ncbi:hypothetical protein G9A89_020647 [Geosiphon pyriformis]|nr:hypothetical protein G9A89_020647 [Geosiphon pyriformis]
MTTTKAKSKKVANVNFPIITNKVLTQEGFSVIETARQNVLVTFLLKNISEKLSLVASGSFFSLLASSSSPVKVLFKRHTQISFSVVSITSKSPKIFNNRPVNKLVFSAFTIPITTTTTITTTSQMAIKAKNSKKQQLALTTALVTPNPFVVSDKILGKIFTAAASSLSDVDGNNSSTASKMGQDQLLAVLPDVVLSSRSLPIPVAKQLIISDDLKDWADQMEMESTALPPVSENMNGYQRFSDWVASNLVLGATFKIKMALLSFLFQLLPGCIGLKSVLRDAVKLLCVEFASQESLNGATKVAIGDEVFLTTLKIARSSGVASVSSPSLSVALHNIPLGTSSDDIKSALGMFGVIISVKLKLAGLWQYAVLVAIHVLFFASLNFTNVNALLYQDLNHLAVDCKKSSLPSKLSFNTSVVSPVAAAANINLDLGSPPKTTTLMLPVVSSAPNFAVKSRLTSLESHLGKLSVLIKSLVEFVGALVVLVTKLLSTPPAMDVLVNESVAGLAKQNKSLAAVASIMQKKITHLEKKCEQICLKDASDDDDKDFSVYDNIFDVIILSVSDQTAKWMSDMVKNSHELVSIMSKIYELDMFDTLSSKSSTSM